MGLRPIPRRRVGRSRWLPHAAERPGPGLRDSASTTGSRRRARARSSATSADGPFPNGFGNPYAIVKITTGRFSRIGDGVWYVGHCNADVRPVGTVLKPGDHIARANHSLSSGWGWAEIGKWDGGPHRGDYGAQFRSKFARNAWLWR